MDACRTFGGSRGREDEGADGLCDRLQLTMRAIIAFSRPDQGKTAQVVTSPRKLKSHLKLWATSSTDYCYNSLSRDDAGGGRWMGGGC